VTSFQIYEFLGYPIGECRAIQLAFEPIFKKYGVDLFLNGHVHCYEREYPVYDSTVSSYSYINSPDTIHLTSGAAGAVEGMDPWIAFEHIPPSWLAFRYIDSSIVDPYDWTRIGYSTLFVKNNTALVWSYFRSSDNALIDSVEIIKDPSLNMK